MYAQVDQGKPAAVATFAGRWPNAPNRGAFWGAHYRLVAAGRSERSIAAYPRDWRDSHAVSTAYEELYERFYRARGTDGEASYLARYPESTLRTELLHHRERRSRERLRCLTGVATTVGCNALAGKGVDARVEGEWWRSAWMAAASSFVCTPVGALLGGGGASREDMARAFFLTLAQEAPLAREYGITVHGGERITVADVLFGIDVTLTEAAACIDD